jgi:hypothetical protein
MNMLVIESICLGIVLLSLALRLFFAQRRVKELGLFLLIASASWLAEDTCIRFYGFYSYSLSWHFFIDRVPVMIPLIWPVVVLSAKDLAEPLSRQTKWSAAFAVGLLVLSDACFIEPIAVSLEFWQWYAPGFFEVPPIGVLGWAFFAGLLSAALGVGSERPFLDSVWRALIVVPVLTHVLLLVTWWTALRWISGPISNVVSLWAAVLFSLILTCASWRAKRAEQIVPRNILLRIPAALFFFSLLVFNWVGRETLGLYALLFVCPYLALSIRSLRGSSRRIFKSS